MKNCLDRDCVLLDGKCDCWIPMKECKNLPINVNETEKTGSRDAFLHGLSHELRSVIGPDVTGNATHDEEVRQNTDRRCRELQCNVVVIR